MINGYFYIFNLVLFSVSNFIDNKELRIYFLISSFLSIILMLSLRGVDLGTDYVGYINLYNHISSLNLTQLSELRYEQVFKYSVKVLSSFLDAETGIFLLCIIFNFILILSVYILNENLKYLVVCQFFFLSFFLYYDLQYNVLRQGLSLSFYLLAISMLFRGGVKYSAFFFLISIGFHNSAAIYITVTLLALLIRNIVISKKIIHLLLLLTSFSVIVSYFGFFEMYLMQFLEFFAPDSYYGAYVNGDFDYRKGFRIEFILLSLFPLLLAVAKLRYYNDSFRFLIILNLLFFNVYLFFSWISYSDRLLVYPWIINILIVSYLVCHPDFNKFIKALIIIFMAACGVYSNFYNPNLILYLDML